MNETVKLLLSLSLSGSILAVLIFVVKPFIKHKLSKAIQYYIWIIVLLRLIIPFSLENSIMNDVFYSNENSSISGQSTVQRMDNVMDNTLNASIMPNVQNNIVEGAYNYDTDHSRYLSDIFNQYLLYLWLFGVIIALAVNLFGYLLFLKYLRQGYRPTTDQENRMLASLLNGRKHVRLLRNRLVTTPMLIGILRPCIIIPDVDFNELQLKNILLHEISHLKHFDIGVKWLTMITTSIHWFNPFMYFIKKEINRACELACDEAVIKKLSPTEKQVYGDTLIFVVAEHKYPMGVLQATMCEEKRSLKERLVAIMKYNGKSRLIKIISGIILGIIILGAVYLGAGIGIEKDTPPNIYISAEGEKTKAALMGTYSWESGGKYTQSDSDHPVNFKYKIENVISVTAKEQLIISTQRLKKDKQYEFTIEDIEIYKDNQLIEFETVEPSFMNNDLYIQALQESGEYIYTLRLNYENKGTVSYGFIVRVDMLTYDLVEISKYKTPYIGDASKVGPIASLLPVPQKYFKQQYISMKTSNTPYSLTIYHEAALNTEYKGEWPIVTPDSVVETNSRTNALVVFCMIDNLDEVTFAFRTSQSDGELDESKYDTTFTFSRTSFEEKYGDLSVLGENVDLLKDILTGKKSAFKGLELYVWKNPELTGNNDLYFTLLMGTNRNKALSEVYDLNTATSDLKVIKQELASYKTDTYLSIIEDKGIDKQAMIKIGDEISSILKNSSIHSIDFKKELTFEL